jgi:DNA-binding CsgD family transcriptional regulator
VFLQITPSERDALELLANGTTTDEIARCLGVAMSEVEARLAALFAKMGTATRGDAVAAAFRRGLVVSIAASGVELRRPGLLRATPAAPPSSAASTY